MLFKYFVKVVLTIISYQVANVRYGVFGASVNKGGMTVACAVDVQEALNK